MLSYIAKRLAWMLPILLGITLISFVIMHLAPGDITSTEASLDPRMGAEARERLRAAYNLDKPLLVQYGLWLERLVHLDFGNSFAPDGAKVIDKIAQHLPVTLLINALAMLLILAAAIPVGVASAVRAHSSFDRITTVLVFIGFAIPSFWLALILMIWLGVEHAWLPITGLASLDHEQLPFWERLWDSARHLVLPVFISAIGGIAGFSRYIRSNTLEVLRQDYITTARAKGLREQQVIYTHALRNALLPTITILGLSIPGLIGGSVIVESLFSIPGMGKLFYDAVLMRDFPVVMGILVIGAVLTLLGNLLADLAYAWADPRVRRGLNA